MANIESNTLLEKLTQINSIKNRLRQSIVNIGGGDYITEQSPFAAFPRALNRTFSDIKNTSRLLEYIVNGGDLNDIAEKEKLTYIDVLPYINDIQTSKQTLVDNLRVKGVLSSVDETLESLVNKVLRIEGGSGTTEEIIYSTTISYHEYTIQYDVVALSNTKELKFGITNKSGVDIPGIILKDVVSSTGNSNIFSMPYVIHDGEYQFLVNGYDDEYFETMSNRYKDNEIIAQFDTIDYCDTYSSELFLNKIGYNDDIRQLVTIYSSSYLGANTSITRTQASGITSEYYHLDNGLVQLSIDLDNENFSVYSYYISGDDLSLSGYSWSANYGIYNTSQVMFLATATEFNDGQITYERVLELYDIYNGSSSNKHLLWHITNNTDKPVAIGINFKYKDYNEYENNIANFDIHSVIQPNDTLNIEQNSRRVNSSYILSLMNTSYIGCYGLENNFTIDGDDYSSNIDISNILNEHGKQYIRPMFSIECDIDAEDARDTSVQLKNLQTEEVFILPWNGAGGGVGGNNRYNRIDIDKAYNFTFNEGSLWNWMPLNNCTKNNSLTPIIAGTYEVVLNTPCFPVLNGTTFNKYILYNNQNDFFRMFFKSDEKYLTIHNTGELSIENLQTGLQDNTLLKIDFKADGNDIVATNTILESTPLKDVTVFIGDYAGDGDLSRFNTVIYEEMFSYNQSIQGEITDIRIDNSDRKIQFNKKYTAIVEYKKVTQTDV